MLPLTVCSWWTGILPSALIDLADFGMTQQSDDVHGPLAGYRVLDFGWVLAGAIPGMILADMGAEVIKVETRQRMDYMRLGRPIIGDQPDPEQNPMFHNVNRGKRSIPSTPPRPTP